MINNSARFKEQIYDWYIDDDEHGKKELERYLDSESRNNFIYIEYSYKELGKDDNWLKRQEREIGSLEAVKRELLLQWTYSSSDSVFTEEVLDEVSRYANNDFYSSIEFDYGPEGKYEIHIVKEMSNMLDKNWLVGVDVAGGMDRDRTAITVVDPADNTPAMVFYNNKIGTAALRRLITDLITTYIPNAVLIPERNHLGKGLIDEILHEGIISKNLFYKNRTREAEVVVDDDHKNMFHSPSRKIKKEVRIYGVDTTKKSRDLMLNEILSMIINERPWMVNNRPLFAEIKGLQYAKNGRIDHAPGGHDDILFSYLVALYARYYEK